jgi:GR25 family glycosyltransferase involved in LPS biosynthesis
MKKSNDIQWIKDLDITSSLLEANSIGENLKKIIATGVDAKILQYEEHAENISDDRIDIVEILSKDVFKKPLKQNCVLINIEKDTKRYFDSIEQLKKVSIQNFVHVKGTDGKKKEALETDLSFILEFLSQFNPEINIKKIEINEFSEINDPGVQIQDGPLGCYCSHLRAWIYAYLNFEDYVIVAEDDIAITNTENIEKYLKCIPDDWDIIFFNSSTKNKIYNEPYYKFTEDFHSAHFYIIKNKCLPKLFQRMYPMNDQVDVLVSDLIKELNIYNVEDTVYQKNVSTNTQNNLHIISTSPNYEILRFLSGKIQKTCNEFANKILPDNEERNEIIVSNLMYDILYNYIIKEESVKSYDNMEDYKFDNSAYKDLKEYDQLKASMQFFIQCTKKGVDFSNAAHGLANGFLFTIQKFDLHNKIDEESKEIIKAYSFGSTAHTYNLGNKFVIKKYNDKLRWATDGHDDPRKIFTKELNILLKTYHLNHVPKIISYNIEDKIIKLSYCGESLYNDFNLPSDWKDQLKEIFTHFTENKINYPEFRLQNMLVLNDKITFIDFGLAEFVESADNTDNYNRFVKLLGILDDKFKTVTDIETRHRLISIFLKNMNYE